MLPKLESKEEEKNEASMIDKLDYLLGGPTRGTRDNQSKPTFKQPSLPRPIPTPSTASEDIEMRELLGQRSPSERDNLLLKLVRLEMKTRFLECVKKFHVPFLNKIIKVIQIPALCEELYSLKPKKSYQIVKRLAAFTIDHPKAQELITNLERYAEDEMGYSQLYQKYPGQYKKDHHLKTCGYMSRLANILTKKDDTEEGLANSYAAYSNEKLQKLIQKHRETLLKEKISIEKKGPSKTNERMKKCNPNKLIDDDIKQQKILQFGAEPNPLQQYSQQVQTQDCYNKVEQNKMIRKWDTSNTFYKPLSPPNKPQRQGGVVQSQIKFTTVARPSQVQLRAPIVQNNATQLLIQEPSPIQQLDLSSLMSENSSILDLVDEACIKKGRSSYLHSQHQSNCDLPPKQETSGTNNSISDTQTKRIAKRDQIKQENTRMQLLEQAKESVKEKLDLRVACYKCEKRVMSEGIAKDLVMYKRYFNPYGKAKYDAEYLNECMHCQMASLDPLGPVLNSLLPDLVELKIYKKEFTCLKELTFHFDPSLHKNEDYEIEVRCMLADSTRDYVQEFPPRFSLRVNQGKEVKLRDVDVTQGKRRVDTSIVIKEDLEASGVQKVYIKAPYFGQLQAASAKYMLGIFMVRTFPERDSESTTAGYTYEHFYKSQVREIGVRDGFNNMQRCLTADGDIQIDEQTFSLLCHYTKSPFTKERLYPLHLGRGKLCEHFDCFDVRAFFEQGKDTLRCPICSKRCTEIILDSFFIAIVNTLRDKRIQVSQGKYHINKQGEAYTKSVPIFIAKMPPPPYPQQQLYKNQENVSKLSNNHQPKPLAPNPTESYLPPALAQRIEQRTSKYGCFLNQFQSTRRDNL
ncbi:hypothetical protein FGO68_gene12587 [Halteria grandinella]|uniref:SP-RING-type domain-containing protein n=1 Tax=Halteria grandinella TaxID=5974 RepID=A0A8J8NG17_HALGN|nr:hypothetical protein FGO68_gene12587 [Halteria grandinella]